MNVRDLIPWGRSQSPSVQGNEVMNPVLTLHRDINRLFDDFWRGGFDSPLPALGFTLGWGWPRTDVTETDKEYRVTAELPGLDEKDVEVTLQNGVLSLKGEKKMEQGGEGALYSERFHGRFQRSIPLGPDVDRDKVAASFKNGELTIVLPKTEEAVIKAKRIPINGS